MGHNSKKCQACAGPFVPDRFHPYQKFCRRPHCARKRNKETRRNWLTENPEYLVRTLAEIEMNRINCKEWRARHSEYNRKYRQENRDRINLKRREWYSRKKKSLLDAEAQSRVSSP